MKATILIFVLAIAACGQNASPEGRLTTKIESLEKELDSVKMQNAAILDSVRNLNEAIRKMK